MKELKPELSPLETIKTQIKTTDNSKLLITSLLALPVGFWLFYRNYATLSIYFNRLNAYLQKLITERSVAEKDSSNYERMDSLKPTNRNQLFPKVKLSDDYRSSVNIKSLINKFDHLFASKLNSYTKKLVKTSLNSKTFKKAEKNLRISKQTQIFEDNSARSQTSSNCSLFLRRTSSSTNLTAQFNDQINELILEIERILNVTKENEQNEANEQEKEQLFALILVLIKYLSECCLENKLQIVNLFKKLPHSCIDSLNSFDCIELIQLLESKFNETNANLFENYNFQNVEGDADTDALVFMLKLLNNSTQNEQNRAHVRQLMCLPRAHYECFVRLATCYLIDLRKCRNNVRRLKKLEEIRFNTLSIMNNLVVHFKLENAQLNTNDVCLLNPFASILFKMPLQTLDDFHLKSTNVNLKQICESFQAYLCLIKNLFALLIENEQLLDQVRFILAKKFNSFISYLLSDEFVEKLNVLCEFEEKRYEKCIHCVFDLFIKLKTSLFQTQEDNEKKHEEIVQTIKIETDKREVLEVKPSQTSFIGINIDKQEILSEKRSSSVLSLIEVSHL